MPNGGFEIAVMIVVTYVCVKFKNIRCYCIIGCNVIALTGSIMVFVLPFSSKAGLLAGYYMVSFLLRSETPKS